MNATLDLLEKRRSVRQYSTEPVAQEERDAILRAAFRAPTAGAMMFYSIIEIDDQTLKDRLAEASHQPFVANAPYLILFLADVQRWMDVYAYSGVEERCRELGVPFRAPHAGDLMLACCDALIAAQTAVIAAESLGIGSCYVNTLGQVEAHQQLFDLPRYTLPITLVSFGRPAPSEASSNSVPRFDRRFIAHTNGYKRIAPDEVATLFQLFQEASPFPWKLSPDAQNFAQENYLRKFNADSMNEMNRVVDKILKNWS